MGAVKLDEPTYGGGNFNAIKATEIGRALLVRADLLVAVVIVVAAAPGSSQVRSQVNESTSEVRTSPPPANLRQMRQKGAFCTHPMASVICPYVPPDS